MNKLFAQETRFKERTPCPNLHVVLKNAKDLFKSLSNSQPNKLCFLKGNKI